MPQRIRKDPHTIHGNASGPVEGHKGRNKKTQLKSTLKKETTNLLYIPVK